MVVALAEALDLPLQLARQIAEPQRCLRETANAKPAPSFEGAGFPIIAAVAKTIEASALGLT